MKDFTIIHNGLKKGTFTAETPKGAAINYLQEKGFQKASDFAWEISPFVEHLEKNECHEIGVSHSSEWDNRENPSVHLRTSKIEMPDITIVGEGAE